MGSSLGVACIGAGHWGKNLVRNFNSLGALAAVCESSSDLRASLAKQYPGVPVLEDVAAALERDDVGAVAIATPAESHGALVRAALDAGKDVFVEKPLCLDLDEARSLVRYADELGRILMVGHLLWYHPAVLKLKDLLDSGELGRLQYIYSNRLNLGKIRQEENILWSFAPHDVSVILGLVGSMPESVHAVGGDFLKDGIVDVTVSILSFAGGVKAHIFVSWLHPFKEQKLVVVGDRKMAVFNGKGILDEGLTLFPHRIGWNGKVPYVHQADGEVVHYESHEPLRAECAHFLDCVEHRKRPRTDGEEALRVLRVLQECQYALENDGVSHLAG